MRDSKIFRKNKNQKEEEQTKFEWIKDQIKNSIFGVFYILMKQNNTTILKFGIMQTVLFVQLLSYSFENALGNVWKSPTIIRYVASFLSTFRVVYWLEQISWDVYIIIYYVCIFLMFLVIIDFVYVAQCYNNRKFPFIWPIILLRYSCHLIITFLFIPIMGKAFTLNFIELFMSFSNCTLFTEGGKSMHVVFKEVECFNGIHILHVTISYFVMIIFLVISYIILRCFYESRQGKGQLSKQDFINFMDEFRMGTQSGLLMLVQKCIYVFAFTFFKDESNYWFLSVILFLMNLLNGIFLYANAVLLFSCFIYTLDFSGSIPLFVLGTPFIVIIILNINDKRRGFLVKGMGKMQKGEDVQKYIAYYLTIIDIRDENRQAAMTLKGYVNHHSEFCMQDDCPLRNFKKQMQKDQKKSYGQFGQNQTVYTGITAKNQITSLESHPLLLSQAKSLYQGGIKKFPKCNGLKIDFAQFLLHKMHNKKEALKELINAEKQSPTFEQQFMIFRYRQIIEDELHEGTDAAGGGLDYVAALNFETHYNQFKTFIEKSALLHYEFWNHLMDDSPDLARLSEQGSRINASIQSVEDQWKKLTQQSTQTPKALRLYASYLIEILNDKELGNEQLQKAKEAAIQRVNFDFNNLHEDASDMSSFAADGSPCVYISGETDRLGVITQCNLSVCRVFGYSKKEELVNHDVETLMPKIYAKNHKKFLEQAIQKPPDLLSNKERQVFGKHYSGYVFPLWLSIKNLPSFLSGRQFVATFKVEKSGINKNVAHLILDKNKEVIDVSSSCINMLDIDLQKFQKIKAKLDISSLLPSLFGANYYQFVGKTGCQIEYQFPQIVEVDKKEKKGKEDGEDGEENLENTSMMGDKAEDDGNMQPGASNIDMGPDAIMNSFIRAQNNPYNMSMIEEEEDGLLSQDGDLNGDDGGGSPGKKYQGNNNSYYERKKIVQVSNQIDEDENEDDEQTENEKNGSSINYDYKIIASNKTVNFQCNMVEIHFETQNLENPNPGYYVRLETLQDKQAGVAKIQKTLKQGAFQFSYDAIFKKFQRELRDKENKEILIDKHYLQLKKIKENYINQQKQNPNFVIPNKISNLTYMTYLNKYQKWAGKGMQGNLMDEEQSDGSSGSEDNDIDEDGTRKGDMSSDRKNDDKTKDIITPRAPVQQPNPLGLAAITQDNADLFDLKKFIPGEGSGKEFLKSEIERMINLLRKKQEVGIGIHTFRRVEPGAKIQGTPVAIGQSGKYEEVAYSVAGLFAGRSSDKVEIDDDHDMKDEESERDKSKNDSLRNTIKSRKAFSMAINDKSIPPPIKRLSRIANIILLCLLAIAVVDYTVSYKQLSDTITNYQVIEASYRRIAEVQKVCYNVRTMILLNQQIQENYYGFKNRTAFITSIKADLQLSLNELYDIQNQINLAQLVVSNEHQSLLDDKSVSLYFKQDIGGMKQLFFSLTESILQIQSSIFTVSNMDLKDFSETNEDVFFVMYNAFNDLLIQMYRSSNFYVNELNDRSEENGEIALILLILSIASSFIVLVVLIPVVASVNRQKDKVLSLFCDIDDSTISKLVLRCEKFINKIQTEDNNEEMDSNEEFDNIYKNEEEDDYSLLAGQAKKSKRSKNKTRTTKSFYFKIVAAFLIVEAYYAYNYGMMVDYTATTKNQVNELNMTTSIEPYFWFSINTQREYFYNKSKPITNQNSLEVTRSAVFQQHELMSELQDMHLKNQDYVDLIYWDEYEAIMTGDLCSLQTYFDVQDQCYAFMSGIPQQGLSLVLVVYTRTLRLQLSSSQVLFTSTNGTGAKFTAGIKTLMNSSDMYDTYVMMHEFISKFLRKLVTTFTDTIVSGLKERMQRRLFLLIFFLILLLLAYVSIWFPLVNSLNSQIYKTKLMLMIIPLEILMRMKNVGKVLQSHNFIQEKSGRSSGSGRSGSKGERH